MSASICFGGVYANIRFLNRQNFSLKCPTASSGRHSHRLYNLSGSKKLIKSILVTDESGVAGPITLPASDSLGLTPGAPVPFTNYQLIVEHPNFQLAAFRDLQIFSDVETVQDVPLLPLSADSPDSNSTTVTPQPL